MLIWGGGRIRGQTSTFFQRVNEHKTPSPHGDAIALDNIMLKPSLSATVLVIDYTAQATAAIGINLWHDKPMNICLNICFMS